VRCADASSIRESVIVSARIAATSCAAGTRSILRKHDRSGKGPSKQRRAMKITHARQHKRSQQDHCSSKVGLNRLSVPEQPRSQASQQSAYRDGRAGTCRFPDATREFAHNGEV
jgi:hypothetical protein